MARAPTPDFADPWADLSSQAHDRHLLHATAVAVDGRGVVIAGPSGIGKSSLALQMIALGATLVCDDAVWIDRKGDDLWADAPDATRGKIEARGLAILNVHAQPAPISVALELVPEAPRLAKVTHWQTLGCTIPLYESQFSDHLASALMLLLRQP